MKEKKRLFSLYFTGEKKIKPDIPAYLAKVDRFADSYYLALFFFYYNYYFMVLETSLTYLSFKQNKLISFEVPDKKVLQNVCFENPLHC